MNHTNAVAPWITQLPTDDKVLKCSQQGAQIVVLSVSRGSSATSADKAIGSSQRKKSERDRLIPLPAAAALHHASLWLHSSRPRKQIRYT